MGTARALRWALVVGGLAGGCNADAVKGVELEQPPQEECFARGPDGALALRSGCIGLAPYTKVDLLVVIDDGPHAAALQARLADALPAFVDRLKQHEPKLELRIGFTSANDGNPACEPRAGVGGALRLSSCREHPEDFIDSDGTDRFDELCAARCGLDELTVTPTATLLDAEAARRPWVEVGSSSNLPPGTEAAGAVVCAAILGIGGCPLTAPLSSAWRSLVRSQGNHSMPPVGFGVPARPR